MAKIELELTEEEMNSLAKYPERDWNAVALRAIMKEIAKMENKHLTKYN